MKIANGHTLLAFRLYNFIRVYLGETTVNPDIYVLFVIYSTTKYVSAEVTLNFSLQHFCRSSILPHFSHHQRRRTLRLCFPRSFRSHVHLSTGPSANRSRPYFHFLTGLVLADCDCVCRGCGTLSSSEPILSPSPGFVRFMCAFEKLIGPN